MARYVPRGKRDRRGRGARGGGRERDERHPDRVPRRGDESRAARGTRGDQGDARPDRFPQRRRARVPGAPRESDRGVAVVKITIELEIEGTEDDAMSAVEMALDGGWLQESVNDYEGPDDRRVRVV